MENQKIFGYCRVSTISQKLERQEKNILEVYPEVIIFKEKFTGTTREREEYKKLKKTVRENDIIVFDSISRMSRNAQEGFNDYMELWENKVNLIFLNEPHLNTSFFNSQVKALENMDNIKIDKTFMPLMNGIKETIKNIIKGQIFIGFEQSEKERNDIVKRITQGQKLTPKKLGRKPRIIPQTIKDDIINNYINSRKKDIKEFLTTYKISKSTFYNYLSDIQKEL